MKKLATMSDVAREAGVSVGTVSHVFGGHVHISEALCERVRKSADKLGYVVDPSARALRVGFQNIIGVFVCQSQEDLGRGVPLHLFPLARELAARGMETLLMCDAGFVESHDLNSAIDRILVRAQRFHLHSLVLCCSNASSRSLSLPQNSSLPVFSLSLPRHKHHDDAEDVAWSTITAFSSVEHCISSSMSDFVTRIIASREDRSTASISFRK